MLCNLIEKNNPTNNTYKNKIIEKSKKIPINVNKNDKINSDMC